MRTQPKRSTMFYISARTGNITVPSGRLLGMHASACVGLWLFTLVLRKRLRVLILLNLPKRRLRLRMNLRLCPVTVSWFGLTAQHPTTNFSA